MPQAKFQKVVRVFKRISDITTWVANSLARFPMEKTVEDITEDN